MNEKILRINHSVDFSRMREKAEWLNYWWSDEQEDVPKRYLLIGDSICRAYRGAVEKISGVPVDYIGTSSILPDERFLKQIEAFFDCSDACSVRGGGGKKVLCGTDTNRSACDSASRPRYA